MGVEDHLASSLITGESRTVWTLPHTISRQAKAPCIGASPHRSSCAIQRCSSVVILLATATSRHLLPNRRQGNALTRRRITRAKPPPLSGQVSAEVITLITFIAPQHINRGCIKWLEALTCNRKLQWVSSLRCGRTVAPSLMCNLGHSLCC